MRFALISMLLIACGDGGTSATDSGGGTTTGTGDPVAGADVYAANCEVCHGADGKAGVTGASDLTVRIPAISDADITDVVQNGFGSMAATAVTDAEVPDLIAYLRQTFP